MLIVTCCPIGFVQFLECLANSNFDWQASKQGKQTILAMQYSIPCG
jgi:hypothetical protein